MTDVTRDRQPVDQNEPEDSPAEVVDNGTLNVAEWITLSISLAIVVAVLGVTTFLALRGGDNPAAFTVTAHTEQIRGHDGAWYLPIDVRNVGDDTAADVVVRAELDTGENEPETAEFTITFLSGDDRASGTVVFGNDPRSGDLRVAVVSFSSP